jgi:hypothetical protein
MVTLKKQQIAFVAWRLTPSPFEIYFPVDDVNFKTLLRKFCTTLIITSQLSPLATVLRNTLSHQRYLRLRSSAPPLPALLPLPPTPPLVRIFHPPPTSFSPRPDPPGFAKSASRCRSASIRLCSFLLRSSSIADVGTDDTWSAAVLGLVVPALPRSVRWRFDGTTVVLVDGGSRPLDDAMVLGSGLGDNEPAAMVVSGRMAAY